MAVWSGLSHTTLHRQTNETDMTNVDRVFKDEQMSETQRLHHTNVCLLCSFVHVIWFELQHSESEQKKLWWAIKINSAWQFSCGNTQWKSKTSPTSVVSEVSQHKLISEWKLEQHTSAPHYRDMWLGKTSICYYVGFTSILIVSLQRNQHIHNW